MKMLRFLDPARLPAKTLPGPRRG